PAGEPRADRAGQRQRALEPHAGSGRQLRRLDGRRRRAREQLPRGRIPGDRPAEPCLDESEHGSRAGNESPGAHLRRGDGTHRRRRDQHDGESGRERLSRLGVRRAAPGIARRAAPDSEAAEQPNVPEYWRDNGGGFGGPIVRNKTFFWSAGETYVDNQPQQNSFLVPTAAERNGDFSGLRRNGNAVVIRDPLTGQRI